MGMIDRRRLAQHGRGLALLFSVVFVGLSLAGYDPTDAPGSAAWFREPGPPRNPCGPLGATLAHGLMTLLGGASWLVVYGLGVVALLVLRRRLVAEVALRLLGFGFVLVVLAATVALLAPGLGGSPPVGSGGYVGAALTTMLVAQVGPVGMILVLAAFGVVGLALCYEILLVWPIRTLTMVLGSRGRQAGHAPMPMSQAPWQPRPALAYADPNAYARAALPEARPNGPRYAEVDAPVRPTSPLPPASAPVPSMRVPVPMDGSYILPHPELLEPPTPVPVQDHEAKINSRAMLLEKTLLEHGCVVRVVQIDTGPVITQFEIELEAGLRVSKVSGLANDLAIALAVPSVRIVAPIPGKTTVGIEVPNDRRGIVRLSEVVTGTGSRLEKMKIPLFLGKDVKGQPLAFDLAEMPHLLIAGRTGTGKSVCLNAMILSILMTRRPDECKLILIDPKKVELSQFKRIPHLMHPVITDEKKAESLLSWACDKMDERYGYLARAEVRNIQGYNALGPEELYNRLRPEDDEERARIPTYMPSIVIIIDEMGDLIAQVGKEVETHIIRLAQKARAAGIHLILATQKPTVDVITGLIKSNLPARIAFQVSSRNDSRVVLDEMGAEKLLGNGDMLFLIPGTSHLVRAQGTYISDAEVQRVCQYLEQYPVEFSKELVQLQVNGGLGGKDGAAALKDRDEMYEAAIEIVIREQRGSTSLLQRALGIGYGRAARLIDFMAEDGIVGEFKSGSAREVLYTWEDWEALKNGDDSGGAAA